MWGIRALRVGVLLGGLLALVAGAGCNCDCCKGLYCVPPPGSGGSLAPGGTSNAPTGGQTTGQVGGQTPGLMEEAGRRQNAGATPGVTGGTN
jgi:hypothetical protein